MDWRILFRFRKNSTRYFPLNRNWMRSVLRLYRLCAIWQARWDSLKMRPIGSCGASARSRPKRTTRSSSPVKTTRSYNRKSLHCSRKRPKSSDWSAKTNKFVWTSWGQECLRILALYRTWKSLVAVTFSTSSSSATRTHKLRGEGLSLKFTKKEHP